MEIERKLKEMGYELSPNRRPPAGNFVPAVRTGDLVYLSGHGPRLPEGDFLHVGKLGADLSIEQDYDCARQVMLNLLASLKEEIGDLDRVKRVVKLLCMINSAPDFQDTPRVANGASDLLIDTPVPLWEWRPCLQACRWRSKWSWRWRDSRQPAGKSTRLI